MLVPQKKEHQVNILTTSGDQDLITDHSSDGGEFLADDVDSCPEDIDDLQTDDDLQVDDMQTDDLQTDDDMQTDDLQTDDDMQTDDLQTDDDMQTDDHLQIDAMQTADVQADDLQAQEDLQTDDDLQTDYYLQTDEDGTEPFGSIQESTDDEEAPFSHCRGKVPRFGLKKKKTKGFCNIFLNIM